MAGLPTTFGNPTLKDNIAMHDAVLVERLTAAGAVIFGKTNVPLLLADAQSYNAIYGTTNNPWDLSRTPGGSSGGSAAALAAGLTALDAGSDIGGSLRNPAHYCGIYAHKPTHGIVPPRGQAPPGILSPSDLAVVGPMGRSAEDLALALDVVAGADPLLQAGWRLDLPPPRHTSLRDFRVAVWDNDALSPVDHAVLDRLQVAVDALNRAGARVDTNARPEFEPARSHAVYMTLLRAVTAARHPAVVFEEQKRIAASLSPDENSHRATFARGATLYHRYWIEANETRTKLRMAWRDFFQDHDVVLAPIAETPAFPHDHEPDFNKRVLMVDGRPVPYPAPSFWGGTCDRRLPAGDRGAPRPDVHWLAGRRADRRAGIRRPHHHRIRPPYGRCDRRLHSTIRLRLTIGRLMLNSVQPRLLACANSDHPRSQPGACGLCRLSGGCGSG